MSFSSMAKSLAQGEIPGLSLAFAKTKINEALKDIYDKTDWSWQTGYSGWYVPALIATGTVTVTPYSDQVIGDAAATAAWLAITGRPTLTERQFRNPSWSLYSIIAYDDGQTVGQGNYPFATLTLDRPWMEVVTGAGQPYQIYQAYFPVPVADFTKFVEIRDTTNSAPVSFTELSQDDLSAVDPKRLMFGPTVPEYAVPWGTDTRTGSATFGYIMYELWPHVLALYPYSFSYKRSGALMVDPSDTPPYPITEECVSWRAKEMIYQWKEAQKGDQVERGAGANWQFLSQAAAAEFKEKHKECRRLDANLHRDFMTRPRNPGAMTSDGYSTNRAGYLNVGNFRR
jgi:hypothetical protein